MSVELLPEIWSYIFNLVHKLKVQDWSNRYYFHTFEYICPGTGRCNENEECVCWRELNCDPEELDYTYPTHVHFKYDQSLIFGATKEFTREMVPQYFPLVFDKCEFCGGTNNAFCCQDKHDERDQYDSDLRNIFLQLDALALAKSCTYEKVVADMSFERQKYLLVRKQIEASQIKIEYTRRCHICKEIFTADVMANEITCKTCFQENIRKFQEQEHTL